MFKIWTKCPYIRGSDIKKSTKFIIKHTEDHISIESGLLGNINSLEYSFNFFLTPPISTVI